MTEKENIEKIRNACPVNLVRGENRVWNLEINQASPECKTVIREILEKSGPNAQDYLITRMKVIDPEIQKIIDESKK